jgi:diguanylate cyclase (GGDEF)-like protein
VEPAAVPDGEEERLAELRSLGLLDTGREERFDRVTRLAQRLFDVPIALVSLVDKDRQWFKSQVGMSTAETPRDLAFCSHAILGDDVFQVADASLDPRFSDNPLVTGDPAIRFYAGVPIAGPSGANLGTLCIIDRTPREMSADDMASLRDLAVMVEREAAAMHLALTDEMTGLSNRRGLITHAPRVLAACARWGHPAALAMCDLNGFKSINDEHGHDVGDAALIEFGEILEHVFTDAGVLARLGGDEFVVLMPGADPALIDRLRHALAERNATTKSPYALTTSIGVAVSDPSAPASLSALLAGADTAMYEDKRAIRS